MVVKCYAKINVVLNVNGVRESDGYHELDMVMIPLELHDSIQFTKLKDKTESYITFADFSTGGIENNIVTKIINYVEKESGVKDHFRVLINKNIPISAGLGGGSSNAAGALTAINKLSKANLSEQEMINIGFSVGSDVPFFVKGKPARVRGAGEIVDPINVKNTYYVLLVKPFEGLSTKDIYKRCDAFELKHYNVEDVIKALETGDDELLEKSMGNALEAPAIDAIPEIQVIKDKMKELGLKIVMMSGSGSCVFALSTDKKLIKRAYLYFDELNKYTVEMTKTKN